WKYWPMALQPQPWMRSMGRRLRCDSVIIPNASAAFSESVCGIRLVGWDKDSFGGWCHPCLIAIQETARSPALRQARCHFLETNCSRSPYRPYDNIVHSSLIALGTA